MFAALALTFSVEASAQVELINSLKDNQSKNAKAGFQFETLINLENTPVENQGRSGTCWSYSGNSFLESEMLHKGLEAVDISEIFTARYVYLEKAKMYVRMHGNVNYGDGGALHDVVNIYRKYGAVPESVYSGLNYGTDINNFGEMQTALKGFLDGIIQNKNGKITKNWVSAFNAILDAYLGKVPETFTYNGKTYTPKTFAKEVVKLNPDDYIEIINIPEEPKYTEVFFPVPDNWSFDYAYNVKMNDLTDIIDNALKKGYSVGWATDVSEKSFSWKNGVAYISEIPYERMGSQDKKQMFNGPQPERKITPEMRQTAFDNYTTTDDHGMHIVGLAKDQNGKEYYIVKNSWGTSNDYKGYLYVTKPYVLYKTTAIMVNKKAMPKDLLKS